MRQAGNYATRMAMPTPKANKVWIRSIEILWRELGRLQTAPEITQTISQRLLSWKQTENLPPYQSNFPGLQELITQQDELGWEMFLEGTIAKEWQSVQATYYLFIHSRKSTL
jgi:hypothetical protein